MINRKHLKNRIKEKSGNVNSFADKNKIRRASLHDYLNGKKDLTTKVLERVLKPLDIGVVELLPKNLIVFDCIYLDGKAIKKGDTYKGGVVDSCWGNSSSSYQVLILNKKGILEMIIC